MMTRALVQNGAKRVYIAGRRLEVLKAAAESLGDNVIPVQCDITSQESLKSAASFVEQDTGYLNLLICNAGSGGPQVKPIGADTTLKDWADQNLAHDLSSYAGTFTNNTASVWYTSMAFLELLDKGNQVGKLPQSSQIVITTSITGLNKKPPAGFAYSQSKAAAIMAVKQLAVALPRWNIRYVSIRLEQLVRFILISDCSVNAISPGGMQFEPIEKTWFCLAANFYSVSKRHDGIDYSRKPRNCWTTGHPPTGDGSATKNGR